ncbi:DUF805 domain-containing protein [Candidatus Ruminimicrobiellum ovillum]|uniref:DUF805 domain-containing protein n=1 Tax=Candidatus Ruminimicrobiellum ovillum TaxID=1947927 RepID=UPI00355AC12C
MNYVKTYFLDIITKHFFDFGGKENRKVYWLWVLNCFIVSFILGLISSTISYIFSLVILLPSLGILVRRLRDAGFSPWLALLLLIPVVGWVAVVILACFPSK